jgi:uncharacterized protein involved in exopolysaccharide biosynthesis
MLDAYLSSQISLIRDFQVTGPAVEAMGFVDNPEIQAAYYANPPADGRDLHAWIAGQVGAASGARMVEDSNIMEILYIASSPEVAEAVVDALRASYVESSAAITRRQAQEQGEALAARITATKASLAQLEDLQNRYEDETGLTMSESGRDEESAKLADLVVKPRSPVLLEAGRETPAAATLRELDAQIAQASSVLGVNNPQLIALRQRRIATEAQVEAERAQAGSSAQIAAQNERMIASLVQQQTAKVLAAREPTLRLRLMQDEINRLREQVNAMTEALIQSRTMAGADTSTTTPIGPATAKKTPIFPNLPLMIGGSAGLGLGAGILLALFVELMARRIRAVGDLEAATGVPVLGELPDYTRAPRRRRRRRDPSGRAPVAAPVSTPTALAAE